MKKSTFLELSKSLVTYRALATTFLVVAFGFYYGLSEQIKAVHTDIRSINTRIDNILLKQAIAADLIVMNSPSGVVTEKGEAFMLGEQEFTKELHKIYNDNRETTPADAFNHILNSLGKSKIYEIINKHQINSDVLFGMVLSFYGGVKYGKYLENKKFLVDD